MTSIFSTYHAQNYPHVWSGSLHVAEIYGGVPSDPKVAEHWIRTKVEAADDLIREAVAETMAARNITADEAAAAVNELRHLNGFKTDAQGLYIGGFQLKAALKEAVNVCMNVGALPEKWGKTRKGMTGWFPEHVFVMEDRLYLGVTEPTRVEQRFVHTWRGNSIQYEEVVEDAQIDFTIESDYEITETQWATIWTHGEQQGIGAVRSQGHGRYEVTRWEKL